MTVATKPLVLVTGPSGFVGAHVFDALLSAGYRVRGTLRSLAKASFLEEKYTSNRADISFVEIPDLQVPHALDEVMTDVDYVCHIAGPCELVADDPVKEFVLPMVEGTKNVISSALKAPNLKRVTVVSSSSAVADPKLWSRPGYVYTEADWNPVKEEEATINAFWGYQVAKTLAERYAWDAWREAKPTWDLITFCPSMVYGPPIHEVNPSAGISALNASTRMVLSGITGTNPEFAPKVATPVLPAWVDVRDVATAHVNSLQLPPGTSERFLVGKGIDYYEDGLTNLRARGEVGLGEVGATYDGTTWFRYDGSKAEKALNLNYTPFTKTIEDVWDWAKTMGFVKSQTTEKP